MAGADAAAISAGTPAIELMERAGRAVARAALALAGGRYGKKIVVVCGKGSNGGDGYVAARALMAAGAGVRCVSIFERDGSDDAAAEQARRLVSFGGSIEDLDPAALADADVVVDAIFGTGFHGAVRGAAATAIDAINDRGATVVAVDIPSGVAGDTGAVEGSAVLATVTVAMGAEKIGTAIGAGARHAGRVEVADIGIAVTPERAVAWMLQRSDVTALLPPKPADAHKRSAGSVVIIGGARGMSGAVTLAARGAVRAGAGYATVGVTAEVEPIVAQALPEVLTQVASDAEVLGPDALKRVRDVVARADAVAVGPGMGRGPGQLDLVNALLGEIEQPLVIDADGLNVLEGNLDELVRRSRPTVLTPHPAELARLLGSSAEEVQRDRLGSARRAAAELGAVVLLKGHRSIVVAPDGRVAVNPTGGPELATAGTGDVLTGVVSALLAGGLDAFDAACASAFLHGEAGSLAARGRGTSGVLAWDVAEALPAARAGLERA